MRVLVVLAQPIEDDTSSMLTARSIINEWAKHNQVFVFAPYPDSRSIYFNGNAFIYQSISLIHYGKLNKSNSSEDLHRSVKRNIFLRLLYKAYKSIDLFGYSITYKKYITFIKKTVQTMHFDVLATFSDPKTAHIIGSKVKKTKKHLFYIQHWGDPLTIDITDKTIVPTFLKKHIEKKLLKNADRIQYVSPITLAKQKELFPKLASKMVFLPTNGEIIKYKKRIDYKNLSIAYCGSYMSSVRNIIPLYEAVGSLKDVGINLLIIGNGDVALEEKSNIKILGRVNSEELIGIVKDVDVFVSIMNNRGSQIPRKLYSDGLSDKGALVLVDGEYGEQIQSFFSQYNRYVFANNKKEEIVRCLLQIVQEECIPCEPLTDFATEEIAKQLIEIN